MPTFRSTRKGKQIFVFYDEPTSVWPQGGLHNLASSSFFRFRSDFLARFSYFKCSEFKEFNKTIIPFALVGYETGYSQLGATRLVGNLPSHIQRALLLIIIIIMALTIFKLEMLLTEWASYPNFL